MGRDRCARSRFATEVVRAIRTEIGDAMPISFRFSQWKQQDSRRVLRPRPTKLEQVLGPSPQPESIFRSERAVFQRAEFEGSDMNLAGWAKKVSGRLSMAVGGIGIDKGFYDSMAGNATVAQPDLTPLLDRFTRNEFDLVGVGRSIAARSGLGSPRTSG